MGIFNVALEIGDPEGQRYETVESMVDSGAAYTIMPTSLLDRLGVVPHTDRTSYWPTEPDSAGVLAVLGSGWRGKKTYPQ